MCVKVLLPSIARELKTKAGDFLKAICSSGPWESHKRRSLFLGRFMSIWKLATGASPLTNLSLSSHDTDFLRTIRVCGRITLQPPRSTRRNGAACDMREIAASNHKKIKMSKTRVGGEGGGGRGRERVLVRAPFEGIPAHSEILSATVHQPLWATALHVPPKAGMRGKAAHPCAPAEGIPSTAQTLIWGNPLTSIAESSIAKTLTRRRNPPAGYAWRSKST